MARDSRGRCAWLAGLFAAGLLLPALAQAQAATKGCWLVSGSDSITFNLPPSVNFSSETPPISGMFLYQSQPYLLDYRCVNNAPAMKRPVLIVGGDFTPIRQALRAASLRLEVVYERLQDGSWNPDPNFPTYQRYFPVGAPYQGDSGVRHGRIILLLLADKRVTTPLRVFLPATRVFKLIADETAETDPGIWLNSTPSRFQYIPSCIGAVAVDNAVRFDTVLTTANYNGKLPQARPFNLTTRINSPGCEGIESSLVAPPDSANPLDQFYLRTSVSFLPQGGERIDPFDEILYLKNADGQENGLTLAITNPANQKIKFGAIPTDPRGAPAGSYYSSNIGSTLYGTTLSSVQTYTAHLERDDSLPLKTGKYSTQVVVRVSWY